MLIGGVAASAAVRTFPFRVYSFPKRPLIVHPANSEWVFYPRYYVNHTPVGPTVQEYLASLSYRGNAPDSPGFGRFSSL